MDTAVYLQIFYRRGQIIDNTWGGKYKIVYLGVNWDRGLLIVNFDFGAGSVFLVDFDEEVLFEGSGWVVEEVVSDTLGFKTMVIFFVGVELKFVVEIVFEFRAVASDFEGQVSILLGLLDFVELLEWGFRRSWCVDFFNWWLDKDPLEFTRDSIALDNHAHGVRVEPFQNTQLVVIFIQTWNVIAMVVI